MHAAHSHTGTSGCIGSERVCLWTMQPSGVSLALSELFTNILTLISIIRLYIFVMDRKRSKYSSEVSAIWLPCPRNIARNKSHQHSFLPTSIDGF